MAGIAVRMAVPTSTTTRGRTRTRRERLLWSPVALVLVLLMAAGSIVMWIGLPLGLLWLASALTDRRDRASARTCSSSSASRSGCSSSARRSATLDRVHGRITGRLDDGPQRAAWLQSMRDERGAHRRTRSVLDTVMIVSVGRSPSWSPAIWFLVFAGSSLPS